MPLTLLGRRVLVEYVVDDDEVLRRSTFGLGSVVSSRLLEALMLLPVDEAVRWSSLTPYTRAAFRDAPAGCVTREGRYVTRHVVAPVKVRAVTISARHVDRGLDAASEFAPFCARTLIVSEALVSEADVLNAHLFGIGLIGTSSASQTRIVQPASFNPTRPTWAWWRFQELAWAQLSVPARPGGTVHRELLLA
jgi:hypothetical protein